LSSRLLRIAALSALFEAAIGRVLIVVAVTALRSSLLVVAVGFAVALAALRTPRTIAILVLPIVFLLSMPMSFCHCAYSFRVMVGVYSQRELRSGCNRCADAIGVTP